MGVQSFQPALLDALGRQHTRNRFLPRMIACVPRVFTSVNLDLMFALPGQTAAEWAADVREAVSLAPDHLSTYCLTFEEDTKLWVKLSQGRVKLDPDFEATLYQATWSQLEENGFTQYEISNFARPGHACRHNVNTWRMNEWVGLGPFRGVATRRNSRSEYRGFGKVARPSRAWRACDGRSRHSRRRCSQKTR